jgi:signal transduction histidine kinase
MQPIQSYIAVPIHLRGALTGLLFLSSKTPGYFSNGHAHRLQAFADHAAIALQNARLHEESQQLAALRERQRLAHELHDAVSQTLYSASVIAEALPLLWDRDPEKVKPRLVQLHRLTRGALAEMRTLLLELRPSVLTEADFDDLLRQLVEGLQGRTEIGVTLEVDGTPSLSDEAQIALFYIAQEALNNVIRHAEATQVAVSLHNYPDRLELSIIDNGRGFDANDAESTSMGLGIMRERAEAIGAALSITGQVGQGTEVVVTLARIDERKTDESNRNDPDHDC